MAKIISFSFLIVLGLSFQLTQKLLLEQVFISELPIEKLDHSQWDSLLKKYVDGSGNVDYKKFQKDKESLEDYLNYLSKNTPVDSWTKEERLAYYINLYNAATVNLILENYPLKSIREIDSPWGKKRISIGHKKYSLGHIEHKILRKMNEPRIHFAINCASYSCPKLLNEAYTSDKLEQQLNKATIDFIKDEKYNKISADEIQLSNIFKWYKKDFTKNRSLIDYIKQYVKIDIKEDADINYLKYHWNLNEVR